MNTEQERADLLPCPFCGGDHLKLFGESAPEWWVCCETCKAATQTRTNKSQAIEDWNRRAALQSQDRGDVKRPVLDSIVDEIHRRADKEWADDGYDFEVTITADEYKALCEEEKAIDHARRIEGADDA